LGVVETARSRLGDPGKKLGYYRDSSLGEEQGTSPTTK
jgi:hypothetical protein